MNQMKSLLAALLLTALGVAQAQPAAQRATHSCKSVTAETCAIAHALRRGINLGNMLDQASGYPVHLGEFGAFEKADMDSRAAYTRLVRDEAERRGIGWAYRGLASTFGVYSPKTGEWVEPIRRALLD